jgi:hypothetical protein
MHPKRLENPTAKRPTVKNTHLDELVALAWEAGWWCVRGGNKHVKCYPPDGGRMISVASTPSDYRTYKNTKSKFRRGGLSV